VSDTGRHYQAVVIGSGFGGTMTALPLARAMQEKAPGEKLLMLERGTWWTTPVGTVQDKEVATYRFLSEKGQPVQFWSSAEHFKGFLDIFTRCVRRKGNEDGLYDLTNFGKLGFLRLRLRQNDGVTILRASGVGGGSLVYSNVTIQPPNVVFEDPLWPMTWDRNRYFAMAREAIGFSVLYALTHDEKTKVNTGLSNIATRSARLAPRWLERTDPHSGRPVRFLDPARSDAHATPPDVSNNLWIDRARVFQAEMSGLTHDFGLVDSSINDLPPEPGPFDPKGQPKNYCERQGRCIVGCLPGARHTLNKQLMRAVLGGPPSKLHPEGTPPLFPNMHLEALAEVEIVKKRQGGGWEVHYLKRDHAEPKRTERRVVTANQVILAAGCVGTSEILLRSKKAGSIPGLSDQLGFGFSTNGDYIGFLDGTRERVSLTRGPITTSFAHFNATSGGGGDPAKFHTVEDNGIPRALSSVTGHGMKLLQSLSRGRRTRLFTLYAIFRYATGRVLRYVPSLFRNYRERQEQFASEDEYTDNIMCVVGMGREQAQGRFRLGGRGETPLRVRRDDGKQFLDDPIYAEIRATFKEFAKRLSDDPAADFVNPFLGDAADVVGGRSIGLTHPLGGCRMATSAAGGVCDEFGRVFDASSPGGTGLHHGLYVADAARIPTALGVNPSLTIAALALYSSEQIIRDLPA
jgi:choline dehydrogenase-like flavoprotein